jgi:hypothetical protein
MLFTVRYTRPGRSASSGAADGFDVVPLDDQPLLRVPVRYVPRDAFKKHVSGHSMTRCACVPVALPLTAAAARQGYWNDLRNVSAELSAWMDAQVSAGCCACCVMLRVR